MQRDGTRHFTAYMITASIYALLVGVVYYVQTQHTTSSVVPKESVIKMSLSQFVPEVKPEPIIEKIPEPVVEEVKRVEPPQEKEVIEVPTPEPIVEKVTPKPIPKVLPKKVVKKKIVKKKSVKKKVSKKKHVRKKKVKKRVKKTVHKQASSQQSHSSPEKTKKSWSALQRKINEHKFYPRIAKKRRMEGSVKVTFIVLSNGNVGNISLQGPKIFYHSAKNAVKSAFPIDVKKSPVSLPSTITLTLHYRIQ